MITGSTLIDWGFKPGPWFKEVLPLANQMKEDGADDDFLIAWLSEEQPIITPLRTNAIPFECFLEPESEVEAENMAAVITHFDALMRVPTIKKGAIMPDACPASNQLGTIPVGGVVACEDAIHPGFHSADVCCSMALTMFERNVDARKVLDAAMVASHFGPGRRPDGIMLSRSKKATDLVASFRDNPFLAGLEVFAEEHFMTQGDGNHFFYVGELEGRTVIVTHHGSRGLGAQLYKRGMAAAKRETKKIAPEVPDHNSWLKASSEIGEQYWKALQLVRLWTKYNHFAIHDTVAKLLGVKSAYRTWNEHNFVFQRSDGLFYHAKGATPAYQNFSPDTDGVTLIPMNMGEPILVCDNNSMSARLGDEKGLGFSPHGAGRNISRNSHIKMLLGVEEKRYPTMDEIQRIMASEERIKDLDIRFYLGKPDISELPSAYKNADMIRRQIQKQDLAYIVDDIKPLGSMMAGDAYAGMITRYVKA